MHSDRRPRLWENTLQDIRYGLRVLVKNRGFSLAAVLTLALGIGANAAIFSLVYGVLLRPLPYQDGGQLVVVHQKSSRTNQPNLPFSAQEIFDYRDTSHTLAGLVEHHSMNFLLLGRDSAERVNTAVVSANFFDVLGVKALLGRTFVAADEAPGSNAVLILSNEYWRTRHGADPNIVGQVFQMNNRPHTVIGVLPPIPQYPVENDVYMPTSQCPTRASQRFISNRRARMMTAFARLKPGVPVEQAQADLSTIAARLEREHPDAYPKGSGYGVSVALLQDDLTRRARTTFLVLLGAAGFVLLIACANVANLLLARLLKLERELAIRAALGAGKARLIRQLLTESVILSLAGGALGMALAPAALALLVKFAERFTTRAAEVKMDGPVLLFTVLISLATGLLFGLAPAFNSSGSMGDSLRQGNARTTATRGGGRLRAVLVVSQVAVSFVLLIGAGLMVRSFLRLQQVNPGFSPDHVLTMRLSPNFSRYTKPEQFQSLTDTVLRKVRSIPGVASAALASNFPFSPGGVVSGPGSVSFEIEGRPVSRGELAPQVDPTVIGTDYFATIRQPILAGRDFNDHDNAEAPLVAIVNQTMARHRWPAEDPIGKRITFDQGQHWVTIVGIASDVKEYGLDREVKDEIYSAFQNGFVGNLVVRTAGDPASMITATRAALHDVDYQLAVDRVQTLQRLQQDSVASPRVTAILLGLFALLALIISASGIAAVMALMVTQRTNELGIRMALGATRESILVLVVRHGLLLAFAGTALGIAGAVGVTRLLASLLFGTSPTEIATFAGVSVVFLAVAAVACLIPARAVTSIDPVIALRQE
ncbi:MAG TPA: ABC transporter permease [Bryobacteraceae bacterium]|nr:ABC transporter permease [Bryobacteraceae bacterium]